MYRCSAASWETRVISVDYERPLGLALHDSFVTRWGTSMSFLESDDQMPAEW